MIDAKRLAELMEPERLRDLADYLGTIRDGSTGYTQINVNDRDALDCAYAVLWELATSRGVAFAKPQLVLREVAGRGEAPEVALEKQLTAEIYKALTEAGELTNTPEAALRVTEAIERVLDGARPQPSFHIDIDPAGDKHDNPAFPEIIVKVRVPMGQLASILAAEKRKP